MSVEKDRLDLKRVLIVDDEPDVLETLEELLFMCDVVKATTFEEAREHLETQYLDIALLDIMGVDGYELLKIAVKRRVMGVMLTAHSLSPEETKLSYKRGADLYVPKDMIAHITTYLNDVLEARETKRHSWFRWLDRFESYYKEKFKSDWKKEDKEFFQKKPLD